MPVTPTKSTPQQDVFFTITESNLLQAFEDVDLNDVLSVTNFAAKNGSIEESIDSSGNKSWTYTPDTNFFGDTEISYIVEDLNGGKVFERIVFNIAAINDAPTRTGTPTIPDGIEDLDLELSSDQLLSGFTDIENDELSIDASGITLETLDASGNRQAVTNEATIETQSDASGNISGFTIKPIKDFFGRLFVNYGVSDGEDITQTSASLNIAGVNDAPDITNQVDVLAAGTEDTTYTFTAATLLSGITDVENQADLTVLAGVTANNGTLTRNGDDFSFAPDQDFNGTVNINFVVSDTAGANVSTSASFTIQAVNDAPELTGQKLSLLLVQRISNTTSAKSNC